MRCPYCNYKESKVTDKRLAKDEVSVRRRRECLKCNKRFTTYERSETALFVIKKDGRREQFSREKLMIGLQKACEKLPISQQKLDEVALHIEQRLLAKKGTEVKSRAVGEEVMRSLKRLNKVAYIRFASVYKDFTDVTDFKKELEGL